MKPAPKGVTCLRPPREPVDYSQAQLGSAPSQDLALQLVGQLLLLRVASIFLASSDPLYLELHFPLPWPVLCLLLEAAPNNHLRCCVC